MYMLFAEQGPIAYLDEVLGVYRQHGGGTWTGLREVRQLELMIRLLEELNAHFDFKYDELARAMIFKRSNELEIERALAADRTAEVEAAGECRARGLSYRQLVAHRIHRVAGAALPEEAGVVVFGSDRSAPVDLGRRRRQLLGATDLDQPEVLFAEGPGGRRDLQPPEPAGAFVLRLYDGDAREKLLATLTVGRGEVPREYDDLPSAGGTAPLLAASPNPVPPDGGGTTVVWSPGSSWGQVTVTALPAERVVPDSATAIARLEALREQGAQYLLIPSTQLWCLRRLTMFKQHVERRYPVVVHEPGACLVFDLGVPGHVNQAAPVAPEAIRRLNWGCGSWREPGWINSDLHEGPGIDISCDIRDGLPLPDDHLDYAVSIHALPMIPYPDLVGVLGELRRVLKPGGVLRLGLPDLELAMAAYRRGEREFFQVPDTDVRSFGGQFIVHLLWYGYTVTLFTADFIEELLERAGFRDVRHCGYRETGSVHAPGILELDNREQESLFVEAVKR
jgi:hypothetical protein